MTENLLRIATRKSALALWQAEHVRARLQAAHAGLKVQLVTMTTQGDKMLDAPLAKAGGKGLFVKELENALLSGAADLAVHSMKDVPVELPEGLHLPVILPREDPRDVLVSERYAGLDALPRGARVGTSSLRRQCQLRAHRPDLIIENLRGNVDTRLGKLQAGAYDAILLAAAGLHRLGLADRITEYLATELMLPAIGQGAIGLECRVDDARTRSLLAPLHDEPTATRLAAERAMNARLGGGCQVPVAGHAELAHGVVLVRGLVARPDGAQVLRASISGRPGDAEELGRVLAEDLLAQGAGAILEQVYAGG